MSQEDVTLMFRALGETTRRRIFEFLCTKTGPVALDESGEVHLVSGATVGEVCCHITGTDKFNSSISFHLKELRLAGLINAEKNGKFMVCSVREEGVEALVAYLQTLPLKGLDCCPEPEAAAKNLKTEEAK